MTTRKAKSPYGPEVLDIDNETGFPVLPDDLYWQITKTKGIYTAYYYLKIVADESPVNGWTRFWRRVAREGVNQQVTYASTILNADDATPAAFFQRSFMVYADYQKLNTKISTARAANDMVGSYPPKKLELPSA